MTVVSIIFLIFILGDFVWCWKSLVRFRRLPQPWRMAGNVSLIIFTAVQMSGFLVLVFGRRVDLPVESFFPKSLIAGVYLWHCLVLLPMVFLWFLARVAGGILWIGRTLVRPGQTEPAAPATSHDGRSMTRREFAAAAVCVAPAILTLGATGIAAGQWNQFRVRHLIVPLPQLPTALDGLTIAQVSDLHVGVFTRGAILDRIVEATNQLRADLVLLPGDLINYALRDLPAGLDVVKRLEAPGGVLMCEGNHDLFEDPVAFRERTAAAGVRLLVNETAIMQIREVPIQVLGLRWGSGGGDPHAMSNRGDLAIAGSMKELLIQKKGDAFRILLAHHPHAFDYAEDIPLTLSGHTHGGQIMLTKGIGFGPALFRYWSGLYQKAGRAMVVSNGVGNWFPLRVQAPAEIVHITLRAVR